VQIVGNTHWDLPHHAHVREPRLLCHAGRTPWHPSHVEEKKRTYKMFNQKLQIQDCSDRIYTSGKRVFYPPPLVPKQNGPGLKGALVPVRAAGARPAPSPGS
jgi:hypothetical protein